MGWLSEHHGGGGGGGGGGDGGDGGDGGVRDSGRQVPRLTSEVSWEWVLGT